MRAREASMEISCRSVLPGIVDTLRDSQTAAGSTECGAEPGTPGQSGRALRQRGRNHPKEAGGEAPMRWTDSRPVAATRSPAWAAIRPRCGLILVGAGTSYHAL